MKELDSYCSYPKDTKSLLEALGEREAETIRMDLPANKLRFVSLEKALEKYKTIEKLAERIGVEPMLVNNTLDNTKMIVAVDGSPYLIGKSSWISISGRIDIYGGGFAELEPDDKANVINARLKQLDDSEVKVIIVSGKVRAIMSKKYSPIPADETFKTALQAIRNRFADVQYMSGYYDHEIAYTKLLFPELAQQLTEIYGIPDTLVPGMLILTSDTGHAGVRIAACWKHQQGSFRQADSEVYVRHENLNGLEKVLEEMPNLFIKYQNAAVKLAAMLNIELQNPAMVTKKVCKALNIGDKHAKSIIELLPAIGATAYDVCMEIFSLPARLNLPEAARLELEEKIAKAINFDYEKIDADI